MPPNNSKGTREEEATEVLIEVIRLAAPGVDSHALMRSILEHVRNWLGCQAAGIRLREGLDFPYFEVQGFPAEFVTLENNLCATGPDGVPLRDPTGSPVLECMCGNVLLGRFDAKKPFFTACGSYWTNSTTDLLASTAEAELAAQNRNRCNSAGYESLALVPLRAGGETIGLLQLNDERRDRFSLETISRIERVAAGIAVVLSERRAREALRVGEEKYRTLFEQSLDGIILGTSDGTILEANPAACAMLGVTDDEIRETRREDLIVPSREVTEHLAERGRTGKATGEMTFVRRDGTHLPVEFASILLNVPDGPGNAFVTFRDITKRKNAEQAWRQSERDLLEAQELAYIGNYALDLVTQQLTWSEGMFRVWGLDPEQGAPRAGVSEWMYPEDYERVHACGGGGYGARDSLRARVPHPPPRRSRSAPLSPPARPSSTPQGRW